MKYTGNLGDLNLLWGYGALERVLRAQGKDSEALSTCVVHSRPKFETNQASPICRQHHLVSYVTAKPRLYSPRALREELLWPGESMTQTLAKLGVTEDPIYDKAAPSEQSDDKTSHVCSQCLDRPVLKTLKDCCSFIPMLSGDDSGLS